MLYSPGLESGLCPLNAPFNVGIGLASTKGNGSVPFNLVKPVISGSPTVGSTLSCTDGTWRASPAVSSYAFQWFSALSGQPYPGATSQTLLLTSGMIGQVFWCCVTATNSNGSCSTFNTTGQSIGPVTNPSPSVRGTPTTGTLATAKTVTLPTLVAGDFLHVFFYNTASATAPAAPTGWSLAMNQADGDTPSPSTNLAIYTKVAAGSDTFVFATNQTGCYAAYACETASADVSGSSAIEPGSGPLAAPSVTTTKANDLVFSAFSCFALSAPTIGTPSGSLTSTSDINNSTGTLVVGYEIVVSAGPTTSRTASTTPCSGGATITWADQ